MVVVLDVHFERDAVPHVNLETTGGIFNGRMAAFTERIKVVTQWILVSDHSTLMTDSLFFF